MFNASETKNESICIFGIVRDRGPCWKFSKCERTSNQSDYANCVASRRGETQRASDGGKARCDYARAPQVVARPTGLPPQSFNANLPRTIAQPPAYLQRTYSPTVRTANPDFRGIKHTARWTSATTHFTLIQRHDKLKLRTLAAMRQRRGIVTREGNILDPATRQNEIRTLATMREHRGVVTGQQANTLDAATRETESRTLQKMRERPRIRD